MVQLTMRISAASGRAHQMVDALHMIMRRAQYARGCVGVRVTADLDEADTFWYLEDWRDAPALDARLRSEQFSQLLALMETSPRQPSLEFRIGEQSVGLEYVAAVRQQDAE